MQQEVHTMPSRTTRHSRAEEARLIRQEMDRFLADHRDELWRTPHARAALAAYRRKLDELERRPGRGNARQVRLRAVR